MLQASVTGMERACRFVHALRRSVGQLGARRALFGERCGDGFVNTTVSGRYGVAQQYGRLGSRPEDVGSNSPAQRCDRGRYGVAWDLSCVRKAGALRVSNSFSVERIKNVTV